jgi:hypothetical protein
VSHVAVPWSPAVPAGRLSGRSFGSKLYELPGTAVKSRGGQPEHRVPPARCRHPS